MPDPVLGMCVASNAFFSPIPALVRQSSAAPILQVRRLRFGEVELAQFTGLAEPVV